MIKLETLYGCQPPQFVRLENREEDSKVFFRKFCDEQPMVVAFLTKYGAGYCNPAEWGVLSVQLAHQVWWNYIGNDIVVPLVTSTALERLYVANQDFVENDLDPNRDPEMKGIHSACETRTQSALRMLSIAAVFDATQTSMINENDKNSDPELVADQNHLITLLGTVLDAIEEVAVEPTKTEPSANS